MFKFGKNGLALRGILAALLAALVFSAAFAQADETPTPDVSYTFETAVGSFGFGFVVQGGELDGEVNPSLSFTAGDVVEIVLINGDGMEHDIVIPDLEVASDTVKTVGEEVRVVFTVSETGEFEYWCSIPGHKEAGMRGLVTVVAAE